MSVGGAQYAPMLLFGASFQECLGPRQAVIYLLIYPCTHLPVPLCHSCCSFLPSFSQHVSHETWDSPTCPTLPLHTHTHIQRHTSPTHTSPRPHIHPPMQTFTYAYPTFAHRHSWLDPSLSSPASRRLLYPFNTYSINIQGLNFAGLGHCREALLYTMQSDLIPILPFCQQRLQSEDCGRTSWQANLLLSAQWINRACADSMQVCLSCQKRV